MSIALSGSELIEVAIGIEKRGIAFYDIMAKSTDNEAARHNFQHLVVMEREHIQIFQDMLAETDSWQATKSFGKEQAGYLQALIDRAVFTDDTATSEMAMCVDSDIQAMELGISAEKDSMLFYYQMRDIMPQQTHAMINKIIAEEKLHLAQLSELKKQLTAS
ncbi:ferritin family protein [Chloroflexota bacterium]